MCGIFSPRQKSHYNTATGIKSQRKPNSLHCSIKQMRYISMHNFFGVGVGGLGLRAKKCNMPTRNQQISMIAIGSQCGSNRDTFLPGQRKSKTKQGRSECVKKQGCVHTPRSGHWPTILSPLLRLVMSRLLKSESFSFVTVYTVARFRM